MEDDLTAHRTKEPRAIRAVALRIAQAATVPQYQTKHPSRGFTNIGNRKLRDHTGTSFRQVKAALDWLRTGGHLETSSELEGNPLEGGSYDFPEWGEPPMTRRTITIRANGQDLPRSATTRRLHAAFEVLDSDRGNPVPASIVWGARKDDASSAPRDRAQQRARQYGLRSDGATTARTWTMPTAAQMGD